MPTVTNTSQPPIFFTKSRADFEFSQLASLTTTASSGDDSSLLALNRSNRTKWITDGSSDASQETWEVDMGEDKQITDIMLKKHNFKLFKIEHEPNAGGGFVDFSPVISETVNADENTRFTFTKLSTQKIRITVDTTQVVDDEKEMFQFIATELVGQLAFSPVIKRVRFGREVRTIKMLSGARFAVDFVGAYESQMSWKILPSDADLTLIETLYESPDGFLIWPGGGDEGQFRFDRKGYRKEDIFLVRFTNRYQPNWRKGYYGGGFPLTIDVKEVVT